MCCLIYSVILKMVSRCFTSEKIEHAAQKFVHHRTEPTAEQFNVCKPLDFLGIIVLHPENLIHICTTLDCCARHHHKQLADACLDGFKICATGKIDITQQF